MFICVKRLCAGLRNIISLRSFWMCLLFSLCSACYSVDTSMPSAKTVANRVAFVSQIVSTLSKNIPKTTSHITIKRLYTSTIQTTIHNYIPRVSNEKLNIEKLNNVLLNPKNTQIAGYAVHLGFFNANMNNARQMKFLLDMISKGSLGYWRQVLIFLEVSTLLPSSQFQGVITTFAKLAPSSALSAADRTHILSVMPK